MRRSHPVVSVPVLAALALAAPAGASAAGWVQASPSNVETIDGPSLLTVGGRVVMAWAADTGSGQPDAIQSRSFAPTLADPLAGASPVVTDASGFSSVSGRPALVAAADGPRVVFGGVVGGTGADYLSGVLRDGLPPATPASSVPIQFIGDMAAVTTPSGLLYATNTNGSLYVGTGTTAGLSPSPVEYQQSLLHGIHSYLPAMARDSTGRYWVAWYSNAAGNTGVFAAQVDPVTGAPLGAAVKAPGSETPDNNSYRIALACSPVAAGCRIAYYSPVAPGRPDRLLTWDPTQPGAVPTVVRANPAGVFARYPAAAYAPDGRLWLSWAEPGAPPSVSVTLGDAAGAGGAVTRLGAPRGTVQTGEINLVPIAGGALVVPVARTGGANAALWATVVRTPPSIPNPQTIRNGPATVVAPKGVSIRALRKSRTKCVPVQVTALAPSRVLVAIYSGRRSIRLFGQAIVRFPKPATKLVCVRVPFRAHSFDVRTPARIAVAVRRGARPHKGEPPAKVTTARFRFFN